MNIFTRHPYRKKYYLTHPIEFFSHYWYDLKCAYQRATKGYCYRDLWNIDNWFLNVFPNMLNEFNKIKNSYPSKLENEKEWTNIINELVYYLKNADTEQTDFKHKYDEEYSKLVSKEFKEALNIKEDNCIRMIFPNKTEYEENLTKNYYEQESLKQKYMEDNLKKAFELWHKWFYALWD